MSKKLRTTLSNVKIDTKSGKPVKEKSIKSIKKENKLIKALDIIAEEKPIKKKQEGEERKVEIKINNHYYIKSTGSCVTLFQKGISQKTGLKTERIIGHFSTLEQSFERLLEEKISDLTLTTLKELKGQLFEIHQDLKRSITELLQTSKI